MFDNAPQIEATRWSASRGARFGAAAGLIFGVAATIGAILVGYSGLMPLRLSSSILLGQAAMAEASTGTVIVVGLIVHFAVSIYWGLLFGLTHDRFIGRLRMRNPARLSLGVLFGFLVYLVNFHVIARFFYPWFLEPIQGILAGIHALFFGLPLALMYVQRERRSKPRPVGPGIPREALQQRR